MTILKPLESPDPSNALLTFVQSSVGKKVLTGLTGLGMVAFVVIHMLGNSLLLLSRDRFNHYAYALEKLKPLVFLIEVSLVVLIAIHAVLGIQLFLRKRVARPDSYRVYQSVGEPSHQTFSSRNMIWTGGILGCFLIWHLLTFKFGAVDQTLLAGESVRDLAQLVIQTFQQPLFTLSYGFFLAILFLHLRHGLWSALQSTGLLFPAQFPWTYGVCNAIAVLLFCGFMLPPAAILIGWVL
jgi:succinate dehydrogenase / fumarate reductase cytochrome b subunit